MNRASPATGVAGRATALMPTRRGGRPDAVGVALTAVATLALLARLWDLAGAPNTLNTDEAAALGLVARILAGHGPGPLTLDVNGQPAAYAYLQAASMRLGGEAVWALRLPAALLGALTVPLFYAIARQVARPWPALGATTLFGSSVYALSLARSGWINDMALPAELVGIWALVEGVRRRQFGLLCVSALAVAAAGYGYSPFRLLPLGALPLLAAGAWRGRGGRFAPVLTWLGVYALASLPLWIGLAGQGAALAHYVAVHRIGSQLPEYPPGTPAAAILLTQVWRVAVGLVLLVPAPVGGLDLAHVPPGTWLLDPVGTLCYWLGLWFLGAREPGAGAVRQAGEAGEARQSSAAYAGGAEQWWWLLVVPLLVAEVPVRDSPTLHAAAAAFPLYFLVGAHGLSCLGRQLGRYRVVLVSLVVGSALVSLSTYATWVNSPAAVEGRRLIGARPCVPTAHIVRQPCRGGPTASVGP